MSGQEITSNALVEKRIKVYTLSLGQHTDSHLHFDTANGAFVFSQHTISTESNLVFVSGQDTTWLDLSTHTSYFKRIDLVHGRFDISYWGHRIDFDCHAFGQKGQSACFYKKDFLDARVPDRAGKRLGDMEELRLEW